MRSTGLGHGDAVLRTAGLTGLVLLVALAAGCGAPAERAAKPVTEVPATVTGAISQVGEAEVISFVQQLTATGDTTALLATQGRYSRKTNDFDQQSAVLGAKGEPVQVNLRSVGAFGYLQLPSWGAPASSCWLRISQAALAKQTGTAGGIGSPAILAFVRGLHDVGPLETGTAAATVSVKLALRLFPGKMAEASLRKDVTGDVAVQLGLAKGVLEGLVDGSKLAAQLKKDGAPAVNGLARSEVHFVIKPDSDGTAIAAPAGNLQMTATDLKDQRCPVS
ncbi:MAG: hypothetical protein JWR35_3391 [Marmoricola sp.]|nr:hypothetical protein [Marmoricola sp.]